MLEPTQLTPAQEALASWTIPPWFTGTVMVSGVLYLRGFLRLHRQMPDRFPSWRLGAYLGGLGALLVAISSPLAAFDDLLLQVHMVQHMLLMFVAPPLILLGAPAIALLRGLPPSLAKRALGPLLKSRTLCRIGDLLGHPMTGWLALGDRDLELARTGPLSIGAALRRMASSRARVFRRRRDAVLVAGGAAVASTMRWPRWTMIPYLLLADGQNTVLSALLTFSDRIIYPYYETVPRMAGITPLSDQITAGVIMWVPGSLFFLVPAAMIMFNLLSSRSVVDPVRGGGVRIAHRRGTSRVQSL